MSEKQYLYQFIDDWDGHTTYIYILIAFICVWLSVRNKLQHSFLIGLVIAMFVINYMNNRKTVNQTSQKDQYKRKVELINPPIRRTKEYPEITDILFNIQDMYIHNPLAFQEIVESIENFFELYEKIERNHQIASTEYDRLVGYKRSTLNQMHSIIFSLENDVNVQDKLKQAIDQMDRELTRYIDHVTYLMDNMVYKNGYDRNTRIISKIKSANEYSDLYMPYSYEIY